ncbi:hypothetical protein [Allocoleopsis sp.]|uniref:hypothetical protein n=1 Tax=Allocoleopsis sp. TaxID=3088169 RepID=UPI002FD55D7C
MSNLALSEYGEIRVTPFGRHSVYDVICVIGNQKNPHEVWKRLCVAHPELLTKCEDFQFEGRGQRLTPTTSKQDTLYLIGLLPGAVGRAYREDAARLMIAKLEGRDITTTGSDLLVLQLADMQSKMQEMLAQNQQIMLAIASMCQQQGIQVQSLQSQLAQQDARLTQFEQIRDEAIADLNTLESPSVEAEELGTRAKIRRLVADFVVAKGLGYQEVYARLYREFRDRYRTDLYQRAKNNGKKKPLDIAEELGVVEQLYAVATDLFVG